MNQSLSVFMGIALTAVVIVTLVFVKLSGTLEVESDKYEEHIYDNMDTLILNEMSSTP